MRLLTVCSGVALLASTATISGLSEAFPAKANAIVRASVEAAAETVARFDLALLRPAFDSATTFRRDDEADEDEDEVADETAPAESAEARSALEPETMCEALAAAAAQNGLPPAFFARLIWQESRFDPQAVSRAGAQGVAQFMPKVAAERGIDPLDPVQALPASAQFLRELRHQFGGNLGLAAAAYNAGARRIQKWLAKRGKLPKETRHYVSTITGVAPERWLKAKPLQVSFQVPDRAPCKGFDETPIEVTTRAPQLTPPSDAKGDSAAKAKPRNAALRAATHVRGGKRVASRDKAATRLAERASKRERHSGRARVAERKRGRKLRVARADD